MSESSESPDSPELEDSNGLSRRAFLKGVGVSAAGATFIHPALAKVSEALQPKVVGPEPVLIDVKINGEIHSLPLEPRATLAETLREALGFTGTKIVCDHGACSACTVWLDGVPVCSCMTLTLDVGTKQVTTIEGLGSENKLHAIQQAFIEHDAAMCGFCTPGMVMSCAALLKHNPKPALDEIKSAISGNLCRCGTYPKVFEAVLAASGQKKQQES